MPDVTLKTVRTSATEASEHDAIAGPREYLAIMRLDHATKHVFIVPGIVLALLLRGHQSHFAWLSVLGGIIAAISIASANYVINEYLDRESDAYHPTKAARAAVRNTMSSRIVTLEWLCLVIVGLLAAALASKSMLVTAIIFAAQGIFYNARPLRTKDLAYLDVISESINNPLRLLIGWLMVDPTTLPPSSIIVAYWFGGAFLMATKRLSEYREIIAVHGTSLLSSYRRSYSGYSESSLTASCLVYALLSSMMFAVFFVKYRIEYILLLPLMAILFGKYLAMSMHPGSTAQKPERLFAERGLMWIVVIMVIIFIILTLVNIPSLEPLTSQRFITIG